MSSLRKFLLQALVMGAVAVVASAPVILGTESPVAATGYGASYYISPPLVQNSYVTTGAVLETFDSGTSGTSCAGTVAIGVISGTCSFSNAFQYGGATTQSASPTAGGTSTIYATGGGGSPTITFTLNGARRYLGFWWSAGSPTNTVKFFNGADEVLTLTTADLMTLLGSSLGTFGTTGSVTAVDGSTYLKHQYFGHPRGHTQASPTARSSVTNNEPFTYLHVFTSGGLTFNKVEFSGGGFEFDNLVVSDVAQTPASNLVNVGSINGVMPTSARTVTFNPGDGTGTMMNQVASAPEALTPNSFTRAGYTFNGWHTTQSGTGGVSYADMANFGFGTDLDLYAQWAPDNLTVTYDSQNGSNIANGTTTTGASISASPGTPTRAGFTFNGWFAASTGGTALTFPYPHGRTANFTLYAQWTPNEVAPSVTTTTLPTTVPTTAAPSAVTTLAPSTSPSLNAPTRTKPGKSITIVAQGFSPGESVLMTVTGSKTRQRVTADQYGTVRLDVTINSDIDTKQVTALATSEGKQASQTIEIDAGGNLPTTGSNSLWSVWIAFALLMTGWCVRRLALLR